MSINIYFNKQYQKWHARIYHRGKFLHIGRYADKTKAHKEAQAALDRMTAAERELEQDIAETIGRW